MPASAVLQRTDFDGLLEALRRRGYTVIGPTVRDAAIVLDEVTSSVELPVGWTEEQDGGSYRLARRDDDALFGFTVGPQSLKQFQLPPALTIWRAHAGPDGELTELDETPAQTPRYAFLGVRSCDLHAMGILDRVLLGTPQPDPADRARTADAFVVAVQCGHAGGTCFCVSMQTGPVARAGFDLALTEIIEPGRHYFAVEVGTQRGAEVLAELPSTPASASERDAAEAIHAGTARQMGRTLDVEDLKGLLYRNLEHPRWDEVADRCLTCGNCTMVCPTCFCTRVDDVTDLQGGVERRQEWDSCFTVDYSYMNGASVRGTPRSRYRQWMTHKLASWWDQFDSSGCVGCGRCITWCPVGIDITEEAAAIRASDGERRAGA